MTTSPHNLEAAQQFANRLFLDAAKNNDLEKMKQLLTQGHAGVLAQVDAGNCGAFTVSFRTKVEVIDFLLDFEEIYKHPRFLESATLALSSSFQHNNIEVLRYFFESTKIPNNFLTQEMITGLVIVACKYENKGALEYIFANRSEQIDDEILNNYLDRKIHIFPISAALVDFVRSAREKHRLLNNVKAEHTQKSGEITSIKPLLKI